MALNDHLKAGNFLMQLKDRVAIELMIQETNLPGFSLGEMIVPAPMVQHERRPGDHIQWNNLVMTVIADENMEAFDQAMEFLIGCRNPQTGDLSNDYIFEGKLILTTNKNNPFKIYNFHHCWIQTISDIQMSATTTEDEAPTFSVEIVYSYYEKDPTDQRKTELGIS